MTQARDLHGLCNKLAEVFNEDDSPDALSSEAREAIEELWEQRDLALWALRGNLAWLGSTIQRGPAEIVAIAQIGPYSAPEIVPGTHSQDPWECLRIAKQLLERERNTLPTDRST